MNDSSSSVSSESENGTAKTRRWLYVALALILVGGVGTFWVQTAGGRVQVVGLKFPTENGQWVTADQLRKPLDVSQGKWSIVPASQAGALGGSRDAAQRERQLIAGREVISDLQNVVSLPLTTDRGIFGGRLAVPHPAEIEIEHRGRAWPVGAWGGLVDVRPRHEPPGEQDGPEEER